MLKELAERMKERRRRRPNPLAYAASQTARTAFFASQYILAARLTPPPDGPPPTNRIPGWGPIIADLSNLYRRDWRNIRNGLYKAPADMTPDPAATLRNARRFLSELPKVNRRRRAKANSEVNTESRKGRYPRYYLQNFHYQSDGWLSDDSAEVYDHQVEVLFTGGADAMRRQALPAIAAEIEAHRDAAPPRMIDIACGTGRFLKEVLRNDPRLQATGLDLSRPYLKKAQRALWEYPDTRFLEANAEDIPAADGAYDIATCIYLFHELPQKVRATVAREMARIVKPGGLLVLVDSIQTGDHPPYDALLERFPMAFHEPYYINYVKSDLPGLLEKSGFVVESIERAFFSKVIACRRLP